jgi:hypothetical protein
MGHGLHSLNTRTIARHHAAARAADGPFGIGLASAFGGGQRRPLLGGSSTPSVPPPGPDFKGLPGC